MNTVNFIGNTIKDLRQKRGLTGIELGKKVGLSQSKLSKIETGYATSLRSDEVNRILNILKAPKTIRQQINLMLSDAAQNVTSTFKRHDTAFGEPLQSLMAEEQRARVFRMYLPNAVPALLQTPDYRMSLLRQLDLSDREVMLNMKQSLLRQDVLWQEQKKFHFILNELVLYGAVAGKTAQIAQLDRIERLAQMRHITVGIIPTTVGSSVIDTGSFVILDKVKVIAPLAVAEFYFQDAVSISQYIKLFTELDHLAVYGDEAATLIHEAIDYLR